jgi:hypothetical protein
MIRSYYYLRFIERSEKMAKPKQSQHLRHLFNIFYNSGANEIAYKESMRIFRSTMLGPLALDERPEVPEEDRFQAPPRSPFVGQTMANY